MPTSPTARARRASTGRKRSTWGRLPRNAFGLHDMHGNVWEWVEDCYKDSYAGAPANGSAVTSADCSLRILRGGAWNYYPPPSAFRVSVCHRAGHSHGERGLPSCQGTVTSCNQQ